MALTLKTFEDDPPFKDGTVDAGLWALEQITKHRGQTWTYEEIGIACGVSTQRVNFIAQKALEKLFVKWKGEKHINVRTSGKDELISMLDEARDELYALDESRND